MLIVVIKNPILQNITHSFLPLLDFLAFPETQWPKMVMGITAPLAGDGFNRLCRDLFDCLFWAPKWLCKIDPLADNGGNGFCWFFQGQLTGLLGNLSLLSYFAGKREKGAMVVQAVGVVATLIVLMQLAIAGAMPVAAFSVTAMAVVIGFVLNLLNYYELLSATIWRFWEEAVVVGGLTVLPQVHITFTSHISPSNKILKKNRVCSNNEWVTHDGGIGEKQEFNLSIVKKFPQRLSLLMSFVDVVQVMWSTFEPIIPHSILPSVIFGSAALTMIILVRSSSTYKLCCLPIS